MPDVVEFGKNPISILATSVYAEDLRPKAIGSADTRQDHVFPSLDQVCLSAPVSWWMFYDCFTFRCSITDDQVCFLSTHGIYHQFCR